MFFRGSLVRESLEYSQSPTLTWCCCAAHNYSLVPNLNIRLFVRCSKTRSGWRVAVKSWKSSQDSLKNATKHQTTRDRFGALNLIRNSFTRGSTELTCVVVCCGLLYFFARFGPPPFCDDCRTKTFWCFYSTYYQGRKVLVFCFRRFFLFFLQRSAAAVLPFEW